MFMPYLPPCSLALVHLRPNGSLMARRRGCWPAFSTEDPDSAYSWFVKSVVFLARLKLKQPSVGVIGCGSRQQRYSVVFLPRPY